MVATCKNLEVHVSHGCNLTCESCSHYSNQGHTGLLTARQADEWFGLWSSRIEPQQFSLLGGEPALNPQLPELISLAHQHWKNSKKILVSNGFLLPRHNAKLPQILAQTGTQLHISIHFDSVEYENRLAPARELVQRWEAEYGLVVHWRASESVWTRRYHGWGKNMKPFVDDDRQASWENCRARWCVQLHEGKIWKCPPLAYLGLQKQKHQIGHEWDSYLDYRPLTSTCSDQELEEFLSREAETYCEMCPAKPPVFYLKSPLISLGTLLKKQQ